MASKIILKKSSVAAKVPVAGDLDFGELAINYTDSKLYFKKADGSIESFSAGITGTVTSVGGTGTVAGLSLSGTVTTSGNLSLSGTLSTPVSTINDSTTVGQNFVKLADPNAITFLRVNADNTVSALSGSAFRTAIGGTTIGRNIFTLTNPSAVTFLQMNADNTASALDATSFKTAIGAGSGSVTSISTGTGLSGGPITTSGTISLANTAVTAGSYTNPSITIDAQGRITSAANGTAAGLDFESYVATAAQTTFAVTYTAPYVIVVVNGAVLHPTDYTATSGTSVVLATACAAGDIVLLQGFQYISAGGGGGGSVDLSSVAQNIVPSTDITYDLGSSTKRWRDLFLSGSTINLGGALIKADATSGSVALVPAPTVAEPNPTGILVSPSGGISVVATTGGAISSQNFADALANSVVVTDKITLQSTTLQTAAAGTFEYDGKVPYFTPQGTQRGIVPGMQYYRLNSDFAGANVNTAQNVLGVGVELSSNTVYHFEAVYALNKSAGTTAHTKGIGFGGTATLNNIAYQTLAMDSSVSYLASVDAAQTITWVQSAANSTVVASSTAAGLYWSVRISGTVSVSAGGTFIPQYTLSAAPGGAYSTSAGSYFLIYPVGIAGSSTSIGTWA